MFALKVQAAGVVCSKFPDKHWHTDALDSYCVVVSFEGMHGLVHDRCALANDAAVLFIASAAFLLSFSPHQRKHLYADNIILREAAASSSRQKAAASATHRS